MTTSIDATTRSLTPTAEKILITAERLFALHGVDGVSLREIARSAGQKNESATRYHFGSRDALLAAILNYRRMPVNARRQQLLEELIADYQQDDVRALLKVIIRPFAELLEIAPEESYYISLVNQLYSRRDYFSALEPEESRAALMQAFSLLSDALTEIPAPQRSERLFWVGLQMSHVVADWDHRRRNSPEQYPAEGWGWRLDNLIDYLAGGLTAPCSQPVP